MIARPLLVVMSALVFLGVAGARADTVLDLSNTASVMAKPDRITASLRAEAVAPTPAAAQNEVNRLVAAALDTVHRQPAVTATTGTYSAWVTEPAPPAANRREWHASQTIDLVAPQAAPMLDLVGSLQANGLAVQSLEWRLSSAAERAAQDSAMRAALSGLRARAETAAELLGLRFASFRTVRLNAEPRPMPLPMRSLAAAAPGFSPPSVEQGPVEVSATVSAEAVLTPAP